MSENTLSTALSSPALQDDRWRQTHWGRLLGHAIRRFDERVLHLMAGNEGVPLALSNLAARAQVSAAHIHIVRHQVQHPLVNATHGMTEQTTQMGLTPVLVRCAGRRLRPRSGRVFGAVVKHTQIVRQTDQKLYLLLLTLR